MTTASPRTNARRIKEEVKVQRNIAYYQIFLRGFGACLLIAIATFGLYAMNQSLSITQWKITASAPIKAAIEAHLRQSETLDFWHSRPSALRQSILSAIPDIADVQIQRQLPHALLIHVTPRKSIALWQGKLPQHTKEGLYLVDEHGTAYRTRQHGESFDLPVLRMTKEKLPEAASLLTHLNLKDNTWFTRLSELKAEPNGWKLNFDYGQQWFLAAGTDVQKNITSIQHLLSQPRWRAGHWRINTRMENRWFIRPAASKEVI